MQPSTERFLKYDMIQPLDKYFDDYASDALKSYVKSGGEELQKCITNEDGELMAIPAPTITAGGVNEMWIRQDWLDTLGLEAPRTWDELVEVAEAFVTGIRMEMERMILLVFSDRVIPII